MVSALSKVTVKSSPLVSAEGVASATFSADSMVSASVLRSPIASLLTSASVKFTVPKSVSGSTCPSLGASAMISADPSCAVSDVCCVVWVQPWVESVSVRVNAPPPLATTDALIASPGSTGLS